MLLNDATPHPVCDSNLRPCFQRSDTLPTELTVFPEKRCRQSQRGRTKWNADKLNTDVDARKHLAKVTKDLPKLPSYRIFSFQMALL